MAEGTPEGNWSSAMTQAAASVQRYRTETHAEGRGTSFSVQSRRRYRTLKGLLADQQAAVLNGAAQVLGNEGSEWLQIEAKANDVEFCTPPCAAREAARDQIERALKRHQGHLSVHRDFDRLGSFYRHPNRLTTCFSFRRAGRRHRDQMEPGRARTS
jgi:hypothetical protein